ncbi:MAG: class I SAM-dependent methyltransferase [Proteobacteria bacterium]|nr:class I SAM-dependent methyltransferase [Pseudomonadota bacterium]
MLVDLRRSTSSDTSGIVGTNELDVPPAARLRALPRVPDYLEETYHWAYLDPRNLALLDRQQVVSVILWGNDRRLRRAALTQIEPGQKVLQAACVYGNFSRALARHIGPRGSLDVIDVVPLQVANCRRKLKGFPQATVRLADAAAPGGGPYDAVSCFFLLHELPDDYKHAVLDALLGSLAPGGKAVFVDYHRPHWAHPLKGVMSIVFDLLEPFAKGLWNKSIAGYASRGGDFAWRTQTFFGGLYQMTVARRHPRSEADAR